MIAIGLVLAGVTHTAYLQWSAAGAAVMFLFARPSAAWLLLTILVAGTLWPTLGPLTLASACGAFGVASLAIAGLRLPWADGEAEGLALGGAILVLSLAVWTVIRYDVGPRVPTFDAQAFAWDGRLGNPAFGVAQAVAGHAWLYAILQGIYVALPLALAFPFALAANRQRRLAFLARIYGASILGFGLYSLVPVCGPIYWASNFPELPSLPPAFPLNLPREYERNAIPSLHLTIAMLSWWALPPRWRPIGALWTAITVVATLALGEHYLVDLLVALPFAVGIQALYERRWRLVAASGALTAVWLVGLRQAPPPTAVVWAMVAASLLPMAQFFRGRASADPLYASQKPHSETPPSLEGGILAEDFADRER